MVSVFRRSKDIVDREGYGGLFHRILTFLPRRNLLGMKYEARYYYEHTLKEREPAEFLPRIRDFSLHIIRTTQEADELEAKGYEFRSYQTKAHRSLDIGGVAFCIFVEKELAHIGWVALTEAAKPYVDDWPFKVDFANKEACTGATLTIPKFRGNGLMKYIYYKRFDFLFQMGIERTRNSVGIHNVASNQVHRKFDPKIYTMCRYFKFLWWSSWKETALDITVS